MVRSDISEIQGLALSVVPTRDLVSEACELAIAHGITAYDASYLALAARESAQFVTADEKLVRKLAKTGLPLRWLGEISDQELSTS